MISSATGCLVPHACGTIPDKSGQLRPASLLMRFYLATVQTVYLERGLVMKVLFVVVLLVLGLVGSAEADVVRVGDDNARYGDLLVSGSPGAVGLEEFTVFNLRDGSRVRWGTSCKGVQGGRWLSVLASQPYSPDGRHLVMDVQLTDGNGPGDSRLCAALLSTGQVPSRGVAARVRVDTRTNRVEVIEELERFESEQRRPAPRTPRAFWEHPPVVNGLFWNFNARSQAVQLARGSKVVSSVPVRSVKVRVRPLGQFVPGCSPPRFLTTARVREALPFGRTVWALSADRASFRCSGPIPSQYGASLKAGDLVSVQVAPVLLRSDDGGRTFRMVARLPRSLEYGSLVSADARGPVLSTAGLYDMAPRVVRFAAGRFI